MGTNRIKISLFINYFVFAMLLNSVGVVILQGQRFFNISKSSASVLEGFKDLPIAICSFLLASFVPKIGIKRAMLISLGIVTAICAIIPFADAFWWFKLLFLSIGVSFALIKVSSFTILGLITKNSHEHSSLMGFLEGFFMTGVLIGNILFSYFIDDHDVTSNHWLNLYWVLSALSLLAFILLLFSKLNEKEAHKSENSLSDDIKDSLKLFKHQLIFIFLACVSLYVLVEQSFQTWTPTFYNKILDVPASMSAQAGAVLAGTFAFGRVVSGFVLKKISWIWLVSFCIVGCAICIIITLPLSQNLMSNTKISWLNAPLVVYVFPVLGIFLSPIYPTINSLILSSTPKHLHSAMSGLIVVFSALGGTAGSFVTGNVFEKFSGQTAFYLSLIPLSLLFVLCIWMNVINKTNRSNNV